MSEPVHPVQSGQPVESVSSARSGPSAASVPTGQAASAAPHAGRSDAPGAAEESVRRKLLIGAALLLALASIYAGVFNVGRLAQIVLAAGATMAVVLALTSSRRRDS